MQGLRECCGGVDPGRILLDAVGNLMNELLFGVRMGRDDPTWLWLQELQEKGVALIGVAGPLNFLPFLRYSLTFTRSQLILGNVPQSKRTQVKCNSIYYEQLVHFQGKR